MASPWFSQPAITAAVTSTGPTSTLSSMSTEGPVRMRHQLGSYRKDNVEDTRPPDAQEKYVLCLRPTQSSAFRCGNCCAHVHVPQYTSILEEFFAAQTLFEMHQCRTASIHEMKSLMDEFGAESNRIRMKKLTHEHDQYTQNRFMEWFPLFPRGWRYDVKQMRWLPETRTRFQEKERRLKKRAGR